MSPIENPECPTCQVVVERIDRQWVCPCCSHSWPVGAKRIERRPKTDIGGALMDDDG